ncbi:hypothetical protein GCM10022226_37830 [Sphaerisporangium flaviroseum]|uniref:Uncharacterized protein n=1 Tax=Sphaerisporangium flaviroseum TaxID=509199 RepID=A0ABP7IAG8_9ACTN
MLKKVLATGSLVVLSLAVPAALSSQAASARAINPEAASISQGHPCPLLPYGQYNNRCYIVYPGHHGHHGYPYGHHHWNHGHHHWNHHGYHPYGHHHGHHHGGYGPR